MLLLWVGYEINATFDISCFYYANKYLHTLIHINNANDKKITSVLVLSA